MKNIHFEVNFDQSAFAWLGLVKVFAWSFSSGPACIRCLVYTPNWCICPVQLRKSGGERIRPNGATILAFTVCVGELRAGRTTGSLLIGHGVTDTRIDTQDRGFRPSFPGRFCSCRSAAVVHLKGTKGAWTTVSGRLFHAATTQNEKKVCLMKLCALSLKIFLTCPRRVFARSTVKNLSAKPCSNKA
ncbi:hypothetical protein CSKR_100515 [Clonorchis sinensis]|uniref:Uncharacterized protein n=1 Tax=Clonorchis sinensis TaxID=79923 RepID=A0A419PZS7_CLOSI|nr:hypothetical protein CSKR_100515 [Clonorchis sinensis]